MRELERIVKFWDIEPQMNLLVADRLHECYVAGKPEEIYLIYFAEGGFTTLDLSDQLHTFRLRWLNLHTAEWADEIAIQGSDHVTLSAPDNGGWIAVMK